MSERRLALVTGASAGIGETFARHYAERGFDLALTARRVDRLEALAAELRDRHRAEVIVVPADLARAGAADLILDGLAAAGRRPDVLVNNAGYGLPGAYLASPWSAHEAFLQLMLTSVCELTYKALPAMVERRWGRIINVASLAGLVPGSSGHTLYGGTKSLLIKFSQSLNLEQRGTGVHVTALCPGLTFSEFHDVNGTRDRVTRGTPAWMWLDAETVVRIGYAASEANRAVVVTGAANRMIATLARLLPDAVALKLMARNSARFRQP